MVAARGEIFWVDLGPAEGSRPAKRRPVLVIQTDGYNFSNLKTTIVAVVTSSLALADMPGNVFLPQTATGLPKDSVVNVTQLATVNKADLIQHAGTVPLDLMQRIDEGLSGVLATGI
jgi:mRNA interferase MazF